MANDTDQLDIPQSLDRLARLLESKEHNLAGEGGDAALAEGAIEAAKGIFDLAISLEPMSHPHLHPFLVSILQPPAISLRSSTKKGGEDEPAVPDPTELLPYTPLSVLTTDGMDPEQVWSQLELRAEGICRVVKEEMTVEEWKQMMGDQGYDEGDSASDLGSAEEGSDDELLGSDEDEDMSLGSDEDEEDDEEEEEDDEDEDDEDEEEEGSDEEGDVAMGSGDESDDDVSAAGPSKPRKSSKAQHPTLDDQFFSIDEFNRMTEEQEATRVTSGRLGGDEDEEADLDDVGHLFLEEGDDDADISYADFFAPPPQQEATGNAGKGKGKASGKGKKKSKSAFADEDDEDEPVQWPDEDDIDETRDAMERVKGDLFDDSEDDEDSEKVLSTHERRQRELADQIAQLESEAIGPKDWTLMGEASARARPENSLLEENLDFEHVAKVVPVITEESVATLEELIKKRILDNNFDSPERVRAYEPTPFLPSRFFELQDTQSTKSLAQIYEDDFQAKVAGGAAKDPRDEKLRKEHDEIENLWGEICYKLDALSSLNFVPKAPKAQITTVENIATTSMETALPSTQQATTMLAPHELFAGPKATELQARSEQTPEEARRARGKARKTKKAEKARLGATAQLYAKKKSVKEQKDEALQALVKSGKGVTVVGKGDKEDAKRKKREEANPDAKRLKL
ncbi:uncharacterized protein EHS24_008012 [Apiotrichum porosum]|uniref:U3 small nucleolar ribonucleoprotein protein MPP10 n=1 Tax=Apiotrichum porosum TaxID=105984 RepID=A0A427XSL2_9TREE|nr:uncharacterized protein EHS24_008012 [Apiotrichum porosum]RSH81820.1 hypothetical protein EHS24_008012 [Apiotrichum porosum]